MLLPNTRVVTELVYLALFAISFDFISGDTGYLYVGIVFILFILYVPGGLLGTIRAAVGGKLSKQFPDWLGRRVEPVSDLVDRLR